MSGYLVGGKAASGSSADVNVAIQQALRGEVVKTITLDRGSEFARAAELQEAIGVSIYFCLPHHPWQRGTNENTKKFAMPNAVNDFVSIFYDKFKGR